MSIKSILGRWVKNQIKLRVLKYKGSKAFWSWRYGFAPETISVCQINKSNYKEFLNDRDYALGHPWNGAYSHIIDSKLYLPLLFYRYPEYVPTYFYFKDESGFLPLDRKGISRENVENFFDLLSREKKLCLKHTHSSVGQGFMLVEQQDDTFTLNGKSISKEDLRKLVDGLNEYIITAYVYQHDYAARICSTSLNTIRFLCAWDEEKREFFLARCFHRFGCNGNVVDNVGSGNGVLVFVDPETGVCKSNGAINENKSGDRFVNHVVHPDHGIALEGMQIPCFREVKAKVLEIANTMSFLKWVGFDVAITKDGFKIIETNSLSSLIDQECEGYMQDKRLKRLFKK